MTPTPGTSRRADLQDTKVDVKVVLCGLWISMLFVFAYVDIFTFWRADVIKGALDGKVPDAGFTINQTCRRGVAPPDDRTTRLDVAEAPHPGGEHKCLN